MLKAYINKNNNLFDILLADKKTIALEFADTRLDSGVVSLDNITALNIDNSTMLTVLNHKNIAEFIFLRDKIDKITKKLEITITGVRKIVNKGNECLLFDFKGNIIYLNIFNDVKSINVIDDVIIIEPKVLELRLTLSLESRKELLENEIIVSEEKLSSNLEPPIVYQINLNQEGMFRSLATNNSIIGIYSITGISKIIFS